MRRFLTDAGFSAASHLVGAGCQIALAAYCFNVLGAEKYGWYVAAQAVVSIAEVSLLNRSSELALKHVGGAWADKPLAAQRAAEIVRLDLAGNWLVLAFLLPVAGLLYGVTSGVWAAVAILSLSVPLQSGYGVSKAIMLIDHRVAQQARIEIAYALALLSTSVVLIHFLGVWGLLIALPLCAAGKSVACRVQASRSLRVPLAGDSGGVGLLRLQKNYWADTQGSLLRNSLASVAENADTVLIGAAVGPAGAANYKLGKSLASLPARAFGPVWNALRPRLIAEWHAGRRANVWRYVVRAASVMLALSAIIWGVAYAVGELVIRQVFGESGVASWPIMLVLLVGAAAFHGITAWIRVIAPLAESEVKGVAVSAALSASIVIGGAVFGWTAPTQMAYLVSGSLLAAAMVYWAVLFRATRGGRP